MNNIKLSSEQLTRATRMSLAMLIGFAYVAYSGVSNGFWVYITISLLLFDSTTIGGTMAKGSSRVLGTFIASLYALVFIIGFANNFIINLIAIVVGIFLSVYLFMDSKYTFAGLLTWTLPVLLINYNDIRSSFLRLLNIMIGALIAYIMHRMFYPVKAHTRMLLAFKNTLSEVNNLLNLLVSATHHDQIQPSQVDATGTKILAEIGKFTRYLEEARIEKFCSSDQLDAAKSAYSYVRHLYRLLNVTLLCLNRGSFSHDNLDSKQLAERAQQIEVIIKLLDYPAAKFIWPAELVLADAAPIYSRYKIINLQEVAAIIHEDMAGIVFYLAQFYNHSRSPKAITQPEVPVC